MHEIKKNEFLRKKCNSKIRYSDRIFDLFVVFFYQKIKEIMGFFKSDITLDCTENAKKFSISDIQHVFSTLESLVLLTQYIPIDILVRTES